MYLEQFEIPSEYQEENFIGGIQRTCYTSYYLLKYSQPNI